MFNMGCLFKPVQSVHLVHVLNKLNTGSGTHLGASPQPLILKLINHGSVTSCAAWTAGKYAKSLRYSSCSDNFDISGYIVYTVLCQRPF
jgi:hypothetical protein